MPKAEKGPAFTQLKEEATEGVKVTEDLHILVQNIIGKENKIFSEFKTILNRNYCLLLMMLLRYLHFFNYKSLNSV